MRLSTNLARAPSWYFVLLTQSQQLIAENHTQSFEAYVYDAFDTATWGS